MIEVLRSDSSPPLEAENWCLRLSHHDARTVWPLRLESSIEACTDGKWLWLRGLLASPELARRLVSLPAQQRYLWFEKDRLRERGSRLTAEKMPRGPWLQLREWLQTSLPTHHWPEGTFAPTTLTLVPSSSVQTANAALISIDALGAWAEQAPAVRLRGLRFAARNNGECIVLGCPLPAMTAHWFVEENGIIIPAGYSWAPRVSSLDLRKVFGASEESLVLWDQSGYRALGSELFVPASRAGIRQTLREMRG